MVRRVLITGSNKGIGLAIVGRCLRDHKDTHCIIACRSAERGMRAIASLSKDDPSWSARLSLLEMDTASDASVSAAAATLTARLESDNQLFAIVNNAGIATGSLRQILETNVLGPRRVDVAFLPLLDATAGRIVNISSGVGPSCVAKSSDERRAFFVNPDVTWAQIAAVIDEVLAFPHGPTDLEANGIGPNLGGYGLSKALLNSYTMMLCARDPFASAKRAAGPPPTACELMACNVCSAREHPSLRINACSPGFIATDLLVDAAPWFVPSFLVPWLARRVAGAKTVEESTSRPQ